MKNIQDEMAERAEQNHEYKSKKSRKKGILTDIFVRLLAILAAFIIWIYVDITVNVNTTKEYELIPIEFKHENKLKESDLVVQNMTFDTVNIEVSGVRSRFDDITSADIKAYVDLSDISKSGEYSLKVEYDLPKGVVSLSAERFVNVSVDKPETKGFSVSKSDIVYESWSLMTDCRFDKENTGVNIDYVKIKGASLDLDKVEGVRIKTGAIGTVNSDVSSVCTIELFNSDGLPLQSSLFTIEAYSGGEDGERITEIKADVRIIKTKEVPLVLKTEYGYWSDITVSPSKVTIGGSPSVIDGMSEIIIGKENEKTFVDTNNTGIFEKEYTDIEIPEGITEVNGKEYGKENKLSANVSVKIGKTYQLTVPKEVITAVGKDAEAFEPLTVNVRINGSDDSVLQLLQKKLNDDHTGVDVIADLYDVTLNKRVKVGVILVFSADFRGLVYEVIDEANPYEVTVVPVITPIGD